MGIFERVKSQAAIRNTKLLRGSESSSQKSTLPGDVVERARSHFSVAVMLSLVTFIVLIATMNYAPQQSAGNLEATNFFFGASVVTSRAH